MTAHRKMKNYYKILGIRETASEEDIRARWIELIRKVHPDGISDGAAGDQRSKEINEAYQVLKHSSTRVPYDLKMAYYRKKTVSYFKRLIFLPAILVVSLVFGFIYLQRSRVGHPPNLIASSAIHPIGIKVNSPSYLLDEPNLGKPLNDFGTFQEAKRPGRPKEFRNPSAHKDLTRLQDPKDLKGIRVSPSTDESRTLVASRKAVRPPDRVKQTKHPDEINHRNPSGALESGEKTKKPNEFKEPDAPNNPDVGHVPMAASSPIEKKAQTVQAESPSLIITEQEVRQFFATYAERYSQKDINGFLSLFSARAVQNGREGFDEIKKMYSDFFDQSQQLRYHLEDMRIRIYEEALISRIFFKNVAEVEARYEIEQILKKRGKKKVWRGDVSWVLFRENGALKVLYLNYQHQKSRRSTKEEEGRQERHQAMVSITDTS